jgi:hypothetical protein
MPFRLANANGRAALVAGDHYFDLERLSKGLIGPDPMDAVRRSPELHAWQLRAEDGAALASLQSADGSKSVGGHQGHLDNEGPPDTHLTNVVINLSAQQPVTMRAGGSYVRLDGLTRPLQPGQSVEVTLRFASGSQAVIAALVS